MRYALAWPIWFKPDVTPLIVQSIKDHVDPKEAEILFFFDGSDPESIKALDEHAHLLRDYTWRSMGSTEEIMENGCHNRIIDWFMNETDARAVYIHQDDTRPTAPGALTHLDAILDCLKDKAGYIGCRDGYDLRYQNFISSPWSTSDNAKAKLEVGQWQVRLLMNPGPLIYPRSCVEKIGKIDPEFKAWYWWDDYALRASNAGLTNAILSSACIHQKHGRTKQSVVYQDAPGWVAKDLALLNARWGPKYNGNVI